MKKISLLLLVAMCLLLSACAANTAAPQATNEITPVTPAVTQTPSPSASIGAGDNAAFFEKTRSYILTGQSDTPEAGRLNWSPTFLNEVNFSEVYQDFLDKGGEAENVTAFSTYLTKNAPVQENWKELFEKDLMEAYSQTPDHYEDLGDGIFQVYVKIAGKVVPYVAVNSRTGWYHG